MPHLHHNVPNPIRRPSAALLLTEPWRAAWEYVAHQRNSHAGSGHVDGHPVVLFPGLASSGRALSLLRKHCTDRGYDAIDWGRGFNTGPKGDPGIWLSNLADHTANLLASRPQSATLLGWSLGGIYAREVAKLMGPRVRQVITIGTPFNADADHTHVGWIFRLLSSAPQVFDPAFSARLRRPPAVPTTSIYSRSDGVVAWQTCIHPAGTARAEDIEVTSSHLGMGWNPQVLQVVADRLAQQPGAWRPHQTKPHLKPHIKPHISLKTQANSKPSGRPQSRSAQV